MTEKEINIAIAEACPEVHRRLYGPVWTPETHGYHNDLNAMHEVEKTLSLDQMLTYDDYLDTFTNREVKLAALATARQRAEAFLRTLGLWREE